MIKISKHIDVLLTNGWDRIAYNILRGLASEGLKAAFGTDNYLGMGYYSKYASEKFVHHNYKKSEALFVSDLISIINKYSPKVYIPTGEEIFAVSRNYDSLSKTGIIIPVSDIKTLEALNNKIFSFRIAESAGLPVPQTIIPSSLTDIDNFIKEYGLPVIVKRGWSRSAQGVCIIDKNNVSDIQNLIHKQNLEFGKFILQKFVHGKTYGVSILMNRGKPRAMFTHKRLRERIASGGPSTVRISTRNPLLENYATKLLESVSFHGVAMIEFKFDEQSGNSWFIECNPRFWGSVGLAINSGVNFPYLLYKMALDGDIEPVMNYKEGVVAEWWLGDKITMFKNFLSLNGKTRFSSFDKGIDFFDDFYKDDPIPFFAWIYLLARRKLVKLR
ncbi:ATP-grasp domain-containing protein [Ignavibacterium sp.]|uniref:carboxylate--amine ligase n=1 Tax=Ignavibacterium sp. TaxID=2651167 RepID=UPI0025C5313E|nr:ATP-grasp domain-containing protein [Ignavibacterium sp.]